MVVIVSRDDITGEIIPSADDDETPAPGEPVGRVNLPVEAEPDDELLEAEPSGAGAELSDGVMTLPAATMKQKVLFGLIAVLLMALAMFVMLQGVFEQKMPV